MNTTAMTIMVDDADKNGTLSGTEWDDAIGGGGNDTGSVDYLFQGTGSSGQRYALDGTTTFVAGQDVSTIKASLSNTFDADISGVICLTKGTFVQTATGSRAMTSRDQFVSLPGRWAMACPNVIFWCRANTAC